MIFINGNVGHKLYSEDAEISYMQIHTAEYIEKNESGEFEVLYEFMRHGRLTTHLVFGEEPEIKEILRKIRARYFENGENSLFYLKAYIYELIAFMYSNNFIARLSCQVNQIERIEPIVRYLDKNFKGRVTLDEICAETNYNKYSLCHNFKAVTGATIFEYVNFLRIHYAVERLKESGSSVIEVATDCGFSSLSYFNRVFKKIIGCAPSAYNRIFSA